MGASQSVNPERPVVGRTLLFFAQPEVDKTPRPVPICLAESSNVSTAGTCGDAMAVFINYRREDSEGDTRAIYNRLAEETDEANLFLDFEAIGAGEKWRRRIDETLGKVRAVIVVIGPRWLDILKARAAAGTSDTVRSEIVAGLDRPGVHVIPVTVQGARFPETDALPEDIRGLAEFHAIDVRGPNWSSDIDRLIEALRRAGALPTSRRSWMMRAGAALAVLALIATAVGLWVEVPSIPKDMSFRSAQKLVEKSGLTIQVRNKEAHDGPALVDVVEDQHPDAGSHLLRGQTVEVDLIVQKPYVLICRGGKAFDDKPGAGGFKFVKYDGKPSPEMSEGSCQWLAGTLHPKQDPFLKPLGIETELRERFAKAPSGLLAFCVFSQRDGGRGAEKSERLVAIEVEDFMQPDGNRGLEQRIKNFECGDGLQ
jgi:TIR domain